MDKNNRIEKFIRLLASYEEISMPDIIDVIQQQGESIGIHNLEHIENNNKSSRSVIYETAVKICNAYELQLKETMDDHACNKLGLTLMDYPQEIYMIYDKRQPYTSQELQKILNGSGKRE